MDLKFVGKYIISAQLKAVTGLHIGGSTEGIEIGGIDNPIIRDKLTDKPYIPGSSLKGKLRHLLEWGTNNIKKNAQKTWAACNCGECIPCQLFGSSPTQENVLEIKEKIGPTRLIVRDAFATTTTMDEWKKWLGENVTTELKSENFIDRVTSEATPRTLERVPAGSEFTIEMIFDVYRVEHDITLLQNLFSSMLLLESSALGGYGSRGSGRVQFSDIKVEWRPVKDYYLDGGTAQPIQVPATVAEIVKSFKKIDWKLNINSKTVADNQGGN